MKQKLIAFQILFFLFALLPLYAGLYSKPHKMYLLKTERFSIIFPEQSAYTARLIAENCDSYFEKAAEKTGLSEKFNIPVVVTPDTAELSATYTQQPYNRIVVCDALAGKEAVFESEMLLDLFYRAVLEAAAYTVRSKNWKFIHTITGVDLFQPIYLVNVTSAFVSGAAYALDDNPASKLIDRACLDYLYQAKLAKKFPSWKQVCGTSDHFNYGAAEKAVCAAFSAYIMQRWGVEKFGEYWQNCGKIHFFSLMPGIFKKVYGISLKSAWKDFEESIELPQEMSQVSVVKNASEKVISRRDLHFKSPVKSANGIIWYDDVKKEVSIVYDYRKKRHSRKIKRLFFADDVTRLTISSDKRYLCVCAKTKKSESALSVPYTRVYDIENHTFLKGSYPVSEACIVCLPYRKYAVAGVYSTGQNSEMRLYLVNDRNSDDILLTRKFATGSIAHQFCSSARNSLYCLLNEDNEKKLLSISLPDGEEKCYKMPFSVLEMQGSDGFVSFSYLSEESVFLRMGYFSVNPEGSPSALKIVNSTNDASTLSPFVAGSDIIFTSNRVFYDELYRLKRGVSPIDEIALVEANSAKRFEKADLPKIEKQAIKKESSDKIKSALYMDDWQIKRYNPLKFMARKLIYVFLPITSLDVDDGYNMTLGAGFSYFTNEDALENSSAIFSYSAYAVDPEDDYTSVTGDNIFTVIVSNSMLPVRISLGGSWATKENGQYTLTTLGGFKYRLPVGYPYQKLEFHLQDLFIASTMHRDRYTKELSEKEGWTALGDTFKDNAVITGVSYDTYRQSGLSAFQERGFEIKLSFKYDMDFAQMKMEDDKTLVDIIDSDYYARTSFSLSYGFRLPRLLPLEDFERLVISLPTEAYVSLYGESGTALSFYAESLLIGFETQTGIYASPLYLHRAGLKAGFFGEFKYDTLVIPGPDFAAIKEFATVFTESELNHYVYLSAIAVFSPLAGVSSKLQVTSDFQLRYYFLEHAFKASFALKTNL